MIRVGADHLIGPSRQRRECGPHGVRPLRMKFGVAR
jgi:hypothetical protein